MWDDNDGDVFYGEKKNYLSYNNIFMIIFLYSLINNVYLYM